MLIQNDPFRDIDQLFRNLGWADGRGNHRMALDAYRRGEDVWVHIDLPGVSAEAIDIDVERNVLTVTAERSYPREEGDQVYLSERSKGTFRRQVHLGENLAVDHIEADYHDGVLTLRIPIAEKAKPRKIAIGGLTSGTDTAAIEADATPAG